MLRWNVEQEGTGAGMEKATWSVCPECLKAIPARRVKADAAVYLEKSCPEHGSFSTPIWSGVLSFEDWDRASFKDASACEIDGEVNPENSLSACDCHADCCPDDCPDGCPTGCIDCTSHEVCPCCVLFEVTQRCNLGCPVCFAGAGESMSGDPSLETIASWYDSLYEKAGICHIQLSGGEPTLRHDLDRIIRIGREKGFEYFQLNTNGILLAEDEGLAKRLKDEGLTCVFLQFDAISESANRALRGADILKAKKRALDNCAAVNLPVVLVPTLAKGINDEEIMSVIDYGISRSPIVRGVHFQPMSFFGRCDVDADRLTIPDVLQLMEDQSSGMIRVSHFSGGTVEQAHCSFSANYLIDDGGRLQPLGFGATSSSCCGPVIEQEPSCCAAVTEPEPSCCAVAAQPKPQPQSKPQPQPSPCCSSPHDAVRRAQDIQLRRWGTDLDAIPEMRPEAGSLDEFLWQTKARGFSITGMAFMDAWTMDFDRLRRCYIFEMDKDGNPIPFCAYNLSNAKGRGLYRG